MKLLSFLLVTMFSVSLFAAKVGEKAPDFSLVDQNGKTHKLSDFKGKYVVLEWFNYECPFVKKHYSEGNMQKLQKEYTGKNVVWLSVVSSAKGKQGHLTAEQAKAKYKELGMSSTAILLDESGLTGKAYGAKVTPHMYVVNPEGALVYNGAIDNNDSSDSKDIATSTNYVAEALTASLKGEKIKMAQSKPYGCGVKY